MVKKRKGARPASRKKTTKKSTRTAAPRKAMVTRQPTGLESSKQINFIPLKVQIRAHIRRLSSYPDPTPAMKSALDSLRQVQQALSSECSPTMVIPTP